VISVINRIRDMLAAAQVQNLLPSHVLLQDVPKNYILHKMHTCNY